MLSVIFGILWLLALIYGCQKFYGPYTKVSLVHVSRDYLRFINHNIFSTQKITFESVKNLPRYKFYGGLIERIMTLQHRFGFSPRGPLRELRAGLTKDLHQERLLRRLLVQTYAQFGMMIVLTWAMILMTRNILDLQIQEIQLIAILFWEFLGIALFCILKRHLFTKAFGFTHIFIEEVQIWRTLLTVGIPLSEVFQGSRLDWEQSYTRGLQEISKRLQEVITMAFKQGLPIQSELEGISEELWHHYRERSAYFSRTMSALKFAVLVLFLLPSYFVFVFFMLNSFTQQL